LSSSLCLKPYLLYSFTENSKVRQITWKKNSDQNGQTNFVESWDKFYKKKQNTKYRTVGHDRLFGGVCFECLNRFLKNVSQSKSLGLDWKIKIVKQKSVNQQVYKNDCVPVPSTRYNSYVFFFSFWNLLWFFHFCEQYFIFVILNCLELIN